MFKHDLSSVEQSIVKAKEVELEEAFKSHLRLRHHMDSKEKKQQELIETLNVEAEEAKIRLHKILETTKIKSDR